MSARIRLGDDPSGCYPDNSDDLQLCQTDSCGTSGGIECQLCDRARARGIPERRIIWGHVLPNAILPIITLLGLSVGHLLGGAAIIETIFSWQGIGNMVVEAIRVRDYPLIQGYVIWMAIIYVTVNLIVDISYRCLDPQIRLRKRVD